MVLHQEYVEHDYCLLTELILRSAAWQKQTQNFPSQKNKHVGKKPAEITAQKKAHQSKFAKRF